MLRGGSQPPGTGSGVTLSGDVTGTDAATVVSAISGASPIIITPGVLEYATGTVAPTITQNGIATQTQGANLTITPQQSTQATNNGGGNLVVALQAPLGSGAEAFVETTRGGTTTTQLGVLPGTSTSGALFAGLGAAVPSAGNFLAASNGVNGTFNAPSGSASLAVGGTNVVTATSSTVALNVGVQNEVFLQSTTLWIGVPVRGGNSGSGIAFSWASGSVALTSGSANTLTTAQYSFPHIKFTGTLTGAGTTVVFPATDGAVWYLDFSAVNFNSTNTIALVANGVTWSGAANITSTASTQFPMVQYTAGAARLVGSFQIT